MVQNPTLRVVCVREIQKSLKQSVKRLLEDEIQRFGLGRRFNVMSSEITTPEGGLILFQGMQDHTAESIKSLEGFDIAWAEEAQAISENSLTLLRPTIRKEGSELWFSWNPRHSDDPVDAMLRGKNPPPDTILVHSSWEDNPHFSTVLRNEMEFDRRRDPDKYAHVWGGKYQKISQSRVFRNWRVEEFDTPAGVTFYFGGDWGFATDPTCLARCWIREDGTLMVDWESYRVGCEIDDTADLFDMLGCEACEPERPCNGTGRGHGMARAWTITADSARPETISYLRRHGYPKIRPARKGPGSVEEGVQFLKSYDVIVHPRCRHTIDELTSYSYKVDPRTGLVLPILEDKKNHVIDSLRYSLELVRKPGKKIVPIPAEATEGSFKFAGFGKVGRGTPRGL